MLMNGWMGRYHHGELDKVPGFLHSHQQLKHGQAQESKPISAGQFCSASTDRELTCEYELHCLPIKKDRSLLILIGQYPVTILYGSTAIRKNIVTNHD